MTVRLSARHALLHVSLNAAEKAPESKDKDMRIMFAERIDELDDMFARSSPAAQRRAAL